MHTNVHNRPLQSFSQDYDLGFHTNYIVYINVMHKWRELQVFEKFFMAIFTYSHIFFARNLLRGSRRRNIFAYSVSLEIFDMGFKGFKRGLISNKQNPYLLDYGDY